MYSFDFYIIIKKQIILLRKEMLNLNLLKDYISEKFDLISKGRPDVLYAPRPPARRKYQTAIRAPDKNFFHMMVQRNAYLWVVVKKNLEGQIRKKIQKSYECLNGNPSFKKLPICSNYQQCAYWVKMVQCQIVIFQDAFFQTFEQLKKFQNAVGFHIVSASNVEIATIARQNRKIKNIYDNQEFILSVVKQNMQRFAITKQQKQIQQKMKGGEQFKRILIRNIIFPNFIRLSKHQKSEYNQYRLHLIGLRKLTADDKLASKDKFIQLSRQKFPKDSDLISQYYSNDFEDPKQILRFYTLDSFFYKILNNTLRIAKNTEQFFSIGEPFNKVFDAIKRQYDETIQKTRMNSLKMIDTDGNKKKQQIVYRGADLTPCECQYLQQNINNYIQINGFISTSKNLQTAKKFAKQRKNKTIFEIKLKQVDQKYKQYDYGYIDLQINKCSAFDQDQVLINALNVFKIVGKRKQEQFDLYLLQYGAIFQILDKDPLTLEQHDKFAYYSFKQLKQMNEQVKDIGQVYLRTNQPEKAIQIYQFKLQRLNEASTVAEKQQFQKVRIQVADAYLANGQPDKALEVYQNVFAKKKQRGFIQQNVKKQSNIEQQNLLIKKQAQLLHLIVKVAQTNNDMDKYQTAQSNIEQTQTVINSQITQSALQTLWAKVELNWQLVNGKVSQLRFQDAYNILKQIQKMCKKSLKKLKKDYNPYQQKKFKMQLTKVYESMAQIIQQLQKQKDSIMDIKKSFDNVYNQLFQVIQKNSYEEGVLNLRKSQIIRRTKGFKQNQLVRSYSESIKLIQKNTYQTNQILPKAYHCLSQFQKQIRTKIDNSQVKNTKTKQLKHQTMIYGKDNARPLKTKMQIGICQRQDKNIIQSLQKLDQAYNTKVNKNTQQKYSIHAKVLFNMGQAYSDKGDDGLALKSYNEAINILKKRLLPKDFQKSVLRYKITLKIGRLYMNSSLRNQTNLTLAERHLTQYHLFITRHYNYKHTDVAISYNCLGALYSTLRKFKDSKQKYQRSIDIYQYTLGRHSIEVAKTLFNLAICQAWLKNQSKSTKVLLQSQQICNKIYSDLRKLNPFEYQSQYIKAEIQTIFGRYQKAIKACEQSIQLQKIYLQAKNEKKKKNNELENNDQINQNRYESYYLSIQMRNNPQYNSLFQHKVALNSEISPKMQNQIPKIRSQDPTRRFYQSQNTSQHRLKCQFKICECLMYLKRYQQAKVKIQQLQMNLNKRILYDKKQLDKRGNPLFKDNLHSKKLYYFKKTQEYMQKVRKALKIKQKKQNQNHQITNANQNQQNIQKTTQMIKEMHPQNFDNF